jgi:arginine deiminase
VARSPTTPPSPGGAPTCCPEPTVGELFVASDTDRLRACLVHTPGREMERLIPANYRWHLYDDLLHLGRAQREHRALSELLRRCGVRVHEFIDLLARVYEQMSTTDRRRFLQRVHDVSPGAPLYVLSELAKVREPAVVARALIEGVEASNSFAAEVEDALYHIQPMANLIFMRDAAAVVLDRVVQGYMSQLVRMPEEIVVETVIRLSHVFGPRGTGEFWIDPAFRHRHRMARTAREYVQIDAARLSLRLGALEAAGSALHGLPAKLGAERVHLELESAFTTEGRHFILEGGNVLALRRPDGDTVVFLGHNARTSADAIDELAYRLLRDDGRRRRGRIGAVIVVDLPDAEGESPHLDTRLAALGPAEIAADRSLVQGQGGLSARFFVFLPASGAKAKKKRGDAGRDGGRDEFRAMPKVELVPCRSLEDALARAGLETTVRWIPPRAPWESESESEDAPRPPPPDAWLAVQQSLWAHGLNLLAIARGIFVGLDRHADFYRGELGLCCIDAEKEVLAGELSELRCCALVSALRARGGGRPVVLVIHGDELSRARGGARSLVMPLVREREDAS